MADKNAHPAVTTALPAEIGRATTLAEKSSKIFILAGPGVYPRLYRTVPYSHFQRRWKSHVTPKSSHEKSSYRNVAFSLQHPKYSPQVSIVRNTYKIDADHLTHFDSAQRLWQNSVHAKED
jgi:hypothetical protein